MIIAVDFDGTCVDHRYPDVGPNNPGAVKVLKKLVDKGHKLILFTMRSGKEEKDAENWFRDNGIDLWAVGENPEQKSWTESKKCYAQLYIDDAALGCPLVKYNNFYRASVDWAMVHMHLETMSIL